jgi:hypothetical protein
MGNQNNFPRFSTLTLVTVLTELTKLPWKKSVLKNAMKNKASGQENSKLKKKQAEENITV